MPDVVSSHWEVWVDNTGGSTSRANGVRSDTLAMLERPQPFDIYMPYIGKATMVQNQLLKIRDAVFLTLLKIGGSNVKNCRIRKGLW